MHSPDNFVASPCIGKCRLDAKQICRGCFRTLSEIINWEAMDIDSQRNTLQRSRQRRQQRARRSDD